MLNIVECGHRELEKYYPLFEVDFDSEELIPKIALHKALMNGTAELLSFTETESGLSLAYALVLKKSLYGYVLLKYFGVLPWYRGKGLGIEAMRLLNKRYAGCQGILAELTEFEDSDPDHLKKLFRFFARFGYVEVPSDVHIRGVKDHVMVKPMKGTEEIAPVLHRILTDVFSRILMESTRNRMYEIRPVPIGKEE